MRNPGELLDTLSLLRYGLHMDITTETTFQLDPNEIIREAADEIEAIVDERIDPDSIGDYVADSLRGEVEDWACQAANDYVTDELDADIRAVAISAAEDFVAGQADPGTAARHAAAIESLDRKIEALDAKIEQLRFEMDEAQERLKSESIEELRWHTVKVLGLIDHAIRSAKLDS